MALNTENIAGKLTYFHEQLHLLHWQTRSFAEHKALGGLYEYVQDFKDDVVEKLMGYTGKRIASLNIDSINSKADSDKVVDEIIKFSEELMDFADSNKYLDISNMAQSLSGEAAKTKYLLTLS